MSISKEKVMSSFFWRLAEQCGAQGVTFIVSIVLARLLDPSAYGVVALVAVFTSILGVFVDCGFCSALIQKENADDLDFSTVFYFDLASCSLIYLILFFSAPLIASFYGNSELTNIVRVMSISLLISGVKCVQQAYVSRNMMFKRFFFSTLGGTIGAAVLGIAIAYLGYGVWALVFQSLFNQTVDTLILWFTVKWRPKLLFSFFRLKSLFSYGWKLLVSSLLDTGYSQLRSLIIGKMYTASDLAYYNKGNNFPSMIVSNINSSINSVLFPTMSAEQSNRNRVKEITRRAIKTSTYIMMPMMMGLAVCAKPLVVLLLTEKWLPCVPYMRIFCFSYAFWPIHTANLNAIKAMGRSDYFLKLEIIKKIIGLIAIVVTMWHSVMWMAYSLIVTSILSQIINSYPNKKLLNYSYLEQLKDMLPQIALTCVMGAIVYSLSLLPLPNLLILGIQVIVGIVIYVAGSKLFKFEIFEYLLNLIKNFKKKHKEAET